MSSPVRKFVCIHGHYYQPPRANPWTGALPRQPSASPYRDWNARIAHECYAPNLRSLLLDDQGRVRGASNNYAKTSFNFGPTLLAWLARHEPRVHQGITACTRGALAQVYNHMIMPLAHPRDQATQVRWGKADFEHRFGRPPAGMWLAETAVNTASLEALAAEGVGFTVLAPRQAGRVRAPGGEWRDVSVDTLDTRRAYRVSLPSGREISLFFYDGALAQGVAFDGLLKSGDRFAARLLGAFDERDGDQLIHIATDGESYGHHHLYGDMALARCLEVLESSPGVELINYADFLVRAPAEYEVEIVEDSSWSCAHGVERWRSDCGCRMGGDQRQAWRGPLRAAFDVLRDTLWSKVEAEAIFEDVWGARDAYVAVVLGRESPAVHAARWAPGQDEATALRWMEALHHAMLMYTSCGWFFDDVAGLEPRQCIAHALYAADVVGDTDARAALLEALASAVGTQAGDEVARQEETTRRVSVDGLAARATAAALIGDDPRLVAPTRDIRLDELERGPAHLSAEVTLVDRGAPRSVRATVERDSAGELRAQVAGGEVELDKDTRWRSRAVARADHWRETARLATPDAVAHPLAAAAHTAAAEDALEDPIALSTIIAQANAHEIQLDKEALSRRCDLRIVDAAASLRTAPSKGRATRLARLATAHAHLGLDHVPAAARADLREVLERRPDLAATLVAAAERFSVAMVEHAKPAPEVNR